MLVGQLCQPRLEIRIKDQRAAPGLPDVEATGFDFVVDETATDARELRHVSD